MKAIEVNVAGYEKAELEVRNCGDEEAHLCIKNDAGTVLAETSLAPNGQRHLQFALQAASTLLLDKDNESLDIAHFVLYNISTVFETGVTFVLLQGEEVSYVDNAEMEKFYAKDSYRLQTHFSAIKNWINDPNGLCYFNGYYHLFYQYYPFCPYWGNMYWGHAVSRDLLHWKHLPIALFPKIDENYIGGAFSGSAVVRDGKMFLFYTNHLEDRRDANVFVEHQEMLVSSDGLDFTEYADNPLIRSEEKPTGIAKDFRDPKVFRDEDGYWKMLLGTAYEGKPAVILYRAEELTHWEYEGILYLEEEIEGRCIECPDFFKIGDKYVLILSVFCEKDGVKEYFTRYHVGSYQDGRFISRHNAVLDFGNSFYALQTFTDDRERRLGIAWLINWTEEKLSASQGFVGEMSLPRELKVTDKDRLTLQPSVETESLRTTQQPFFALQNKLWADERMVLPLDSEIAEIKIKLAAVGEEFALSWCGDKEEHPYVSIVYTRSDNMITVIYRKEQEVYKAVHKAEMTDGFMDMHLYFDRSSLEAFFAGYTAMGTFRFFAEQPAAKLVLECRGKADVAEISIWALQSIWKDNNQKGRE